MPAIDPIPSSVLEQHKTADVAFHNGDATGRKRSWSHREPVTLFGAAVTKAGWAEIGPAFDWLASRFSNCTAFDIEVIAAGTSGDLAYIAAIERTTCSVGGAAPAPYALRVTTVLRRDGGEWKVIHRHGDPYDDASGKQVARI